VEDGEPSRCYGTTVLKMLVRSQNHVLTEGRDALTFDTSLVEYFCNQGRGMEVVPVGDRAYWMMQKILQPSKRIIFCRIDPCTGRVLSTEEKTVADAMTLEDAAPHESGMSSLLNIDRSDESSVENVIGSMFDILCATTNLERGVKSRSVMCSPTSCCYDNNDAFMQHSFHPQRINRVAHARW
jgi:hypothetical protein